MGELGDGGGREEGGEEKRKRWRGWRVDGKRRWMNGGCIGAGSGGGGGGGF